MTDKEAHILTALQTCLLAAAPRPGAFRIIVIKIQDLLICHVAERLPWTSPPPLLYVIMPKLDKDSDGQTAEVSTH